MDIRTRTGKIVIALLDNIHERRKLVLALSCAVVFITTYILILPAFTLEKDEAAEQGGIDVPAAEQSADAIHDTGANSDESADADSGEVSAGKQESADTGPPAPITIQNDDSKDYSIAVEGDNSVLSEGMNVNVREIDQSTGKLKKEYDELYFGALEAVQKEEGSEKPSSFAFAKFYDISLIDGKTEVEPDSAVDVKISFGEELQKELRVKDPDRVYIVHFVVDKKTGEVAPKVLDTDVTDITVKNNKVTEAAFTTESFSVFAVVYTQLSTNVLAADGKTYKITVTFGDDAGIPEGASLEAEEILPDSEEYKDCIAKAMEALLNHGNQQDGANEKRDESTSESIQIDFARFFDIRIMAGNEKVEPSAPVKVVVTYTEPIEIMDDGEICAVHFAESGIEVIEASADEERKEVCFTQDSFSVTGTIVTSGNNWPSSNGKYLMYAEVDGEYYAVAHDGSLAPITVSNGKVTTDFSADIIDADYLWNYETRQSGFFNTNHFVFYNNGSEDVYLDPREDDGLNDNIQSWSMPALARENGGRIRSSVSGSTGLYTGINSAAITGRQERSNAVPIQFASIPRTLTVHFVDRDGTPITGVTYNGNNNYPVTENSDGTYSIPYNWEGTSGSVNLETDFSRSGYTYASSHLAGTRDGVNYTHNGLTIDAKLAERNNNLYFYSDCGDQYANPRGNLGYGSLAEYNINGAMSVPKEAVNSTTNVGTTNYSRSDTDKDIYVIMDPLPTNSQSGGGGDITVNDPTFDKKLVSNGDGTYTLSLSVTGAAKNTESNPKANIVFIIDTSSSMRKNSSNPNSTSSPTRLEDTKDAAEEFAKALLSSNTTGDNADKIEIAMVTFDGSAVSSGNWYTTYNGSDGFKSEVDKLIPANMHTGTDWEDALKKAYALGTEKKKDGDATYVVFFTDGEPSQYTNFSGEGEYTNPNRGYRYWYSCFLSREAANDEARAIVNSGMTLYSIFAYNPISDTYAATGENGSTLLYNATAYAYNTDEYVTGGTNSLDGKRYFLAQTTGQLNNAFASILNSINEYIGVTDVKVNDSITSLSSVGITTLGGNYTGFKYTRSGGKYGPEEQTWEDAPSATYNSDGVHWDLGNSLLEDGVTYKVSFVVWPSQEAYDWVANLNNGIRDWSDLEAAHLQDHFLRVEDSSTPSGYRYEVATNPPSRDSEGHIINNRIEYTKTHRETVGNLPAGVTLDRPIEETDPVTGTKTTTTFTQNPDGTTFTKTVVTQAKSAFGPPDLNMDLDDTTIKVQKRWVADRIQELVAFLFNTSTGELREDKKNIDFVINQGAAVAPYTETEYKTITLGFTGYEEVDGKQVPVFDWADDPQQVEVSGRTYSVGTVWEEPLDIAVGLMLTPDKAVEHGIDLNDPKYIPVYENEDSTDVLYYVLEKGHDYEITEPNLDYRFDFQTDKYHPMLVNKVLRDAKIKYKTAGGREIGILESITPEGQRLSAMTGDNVLRGELTVQKNVLDMEGNPDTSDDARSKVFPMTVVLTNEDPVFFNGETADEQNVPWIGVQHGNSEHIYYYHRFLEDGTIEYADESTACVNGDYAQGLNPGYFGHGMTESEDKKSATETIYLTAADKWVVTNIPPGTTYSITEDSVRGYEFVSAEELESDPEKLVTDGASITGAVPPAHVTEVLFTNQKVIVPANVMVKKTDDAEDSTNYLNGAVFKLLYRADSSETYTNVSNEVVPELDSESKFVVPTEGIKLTGLIDGQYQLQEISPPTGYVLVDPYPVTFTVSEGIITGTDGTITGVRYSAATETNDAEFIVPNTPGASLPSAGGIGTTIFYIFGSMLAVGCAIVLIARRRIRKN